MQALAEKHGISDIFQDNGGKLLQLILLTGFNVNRKREGHDATDSTGKNVEFKTVNVLKTNQFSTHHHLNPGIIAKYREADWYFAVYQGIVLEELWGMEPILLEPLFSRWEARYQLTGREINNPKIPLKYVRAHGKKC